MTGADRTGDALLSQFYDATVALIDGVETAGFGIAVSGGPDSMALLHLARLAFPGRVAAATVDHGLRPESADEAAMVAAFCAQKAIPHATLTPDRPPEGNLQAWARGIRYALLDDWRVAHGLDWILTAHHADDQLETMLMRINRGAGLGGLAGVRARTGRVLRPLLGVRKSDLLAYAQAADLPHVIDPSNSNPRFDRAALRTYLADIDWLDPIAASRSAAALGEAQAALDWAVDDIAARHIRGQGRDILLDRTDFPREIRRRLLLHMLSLADPAMPPPRGDAIDRLIAAAAAGRRSSIGEWSLKGGLTWLLSPAPPRALS